MLVNAKAMALFGITRATRAPEGGEIIHDAAGEPTGVFVDNAERLVTPQERTEPELRRALELAMDECLAEGRHEPDRRRRAARASSPSTRSWRPPGTPAHAALRDGERACRRCGRSASPSPASEGPAGRARGEALRGRRPRLARRGAPRALRRRRGQPGPGADAARGDAGGRALRARPRLPGRHPRDRRPGQPDRARHLREGVRRAARGERPALPHRARADPRRRGHPALRQARRARLDAGHPLSLRPPLGPEAPGRRARGRGRLRVAEAARHGSAHPERHRRAGRGRLADPELPRLGHARRTPTASRPAASTPTRSSPARRRCAR